MLDRRRLLAMGLGAGAGLGLPLAAQAHGLARKPARPHAGHGPSHHLLKRVGLHHPRHPPAMALEHPSLRPVLERVSFEPRAISLKNLHTDETLHAVYWEKGQYVPDALQAVNQLLRDFRTGEVHPISPDLLNLITDVRDRVGSRAPFQVISGYRSPQTNAMLREQSAEVAQHSLHMDGMAIDIALEDVQLDHVRLAGMDLSRGGVGYYPGRFVHLDVGPVRHWQGA